MLAAGVLRITVVADFLQPQITKETRKGNTYCHQSAVFNMKKNIDIKKVANSYVTAILER